MDNAARATVKAVQTDINSDWRVIDFDPEAGNAEALSRPGLDTSAWHKLNLPGDVNAAMVRDGRTPNPHFGDDARQCYWVSAREWWLRREFTCRPEAVAAVNELCLDGVDGHVDLFLNGHCLGRMENAFRPHRFDIGARLHTDRPNVLLLRFQAIDAVLGRARSDDLIGSWDNLRALMRKPQFSFGWDWALPLPSIGIMGYVRLAHHAGPQLLDVSVQTRVSGRLDFKFRVNAAARDAGCRIRVMVRGHGENRVTDVDRPGRCFSHGSIMIESPELWWPRGMGPQALYDYAVELIVGDAVADRRSGRLGIRDVHIEEDPFTPEAGAGISFWLAVNGRRVFCKGGNWIPTELWPAEATDEQYRFWLNKSAEANFNMLRVWGGGIYERDLFYDLCDELGIMVWQDFMFASTGYPVDRLRHEIIAEAEHQIRRLRNRPAVVLWCGCNEDVFSWRLPDENAAAAAMADTGVYARTSGELKVNRLRDDPQIYSMVLRGLVGKLGLGVPYLESSPQSYEDAGNEPESGNSHLSCWKYALFVCRERPEAFRRHFEQVQSFDSEFCIQGPCAQQSLEQFLPAGHRWPPDRVWEYHIQRGHADLPHYQQTLWIAGGIFGEIDSLQSYVKHGQATHAEMMRAEFESARRDRPNNGGTMMWMLNDCWPTSNWSIIDYYRRPKPAYYAAKRACADVLPIVFERKGMIEYFLSNDSPAPCDAHIRCGQARLDGSLVWSSERDVQAGPMATVRFHSVARAGLDLGLGDYLFIEARVNGMTLLPVCYFPDGWKAIPWPEPKVTLSLVDRKRAAAGWVNEVEVHTDRYARFCHLLLSGNDGDAWFDDNFFDLPAGCRHGVRIHASRPLNISDLDVGSWHTQWS